MKPKQHIRQPAQFATWLTDWQSWLPTRGNVLFTFLMIGTLLYTQQAGAITLGGLAPKQARSTQSLTTTIPYQGRLTDGAGNPLSGAHIMQFNLYQEPEGGNPVWTETRLGESSVQVVDGLFNVMLGSVAPLAQSVITENSELYLGTTIGANNELTPRIHLGRVPYAVQADYALTVPDNSITTDKLNFMTIRPIDHKTCHSCGNPQEVGVVGWLPVKGQDVNDILEITVSTQGFPILVQMTAGYATTANTVHYCGIEVLQNGERKRFIHMEGSRVGTTDYSCSGSWLFDTLPSGTYTFRAMGHMGPTDVTWIRQRQIVAYEFTSNF